MPLTVDEHAALTTLQHASTPLGIFDVADTMAPPPAKPDGRTRETQQCQQRRLEVAEAFIALVGRGLADVAIPTDNHTHGNLYMITETGHAELASAHANGVQA